VISAVWLYQQMGLDDPFNDTSFDRATWRQHPTAEFDNPRGHMLESLIDHLKERRPSRNEVVELLGPSERKCGTLAPPVGSTETCLSYELGSWSGFRMDPDTLDVYFREDGVFLEAYAVQH